MSSRPTTPFVSKGKAKRARPPKAKPPKAGSTAEVLFGIVKAALFAAVLTLGLILLFAFVLQQGWLKDGAIPLVNAILKVLGAAFASYLAIRRCEKKRWAVGVGAGICYILLAFVVFSIAADHFSFSVALFADIAMGGVAGMLCAMLVGVHK